MNAPTGPIPCTGSEHLDLLVDELDRLVARVRTATGMVHPDDVATRRAAEDEAVADATLRLDGGLRSTTDPSGMERLERPGTWLDALGGTVERTVEGPAGEDGPVDAATLARMAALEREGVEAGLAADDLAPAFGRTSADAGGLGTALTLLHGRITRGLVADDRAGRLRRGPRVVHDASVGRVLFFPTEPKHLPDAWDGLLRHLTGSGAGAGAARAPSAVRAALLHLELLRHQPFDAANGRIARAASRLALLADELLPSGLGAPDAVHAEDPLRYHEEVGASLRRRDATRWAERVLEAHGTALRRTLDALEGGIQDGPTEASQEGSPDTLGTTFTLGDVVDVFGGPSGAARERCSTWVVAGLADRVIGTGGLRFRRR